ncbi:hypothetical protein SAMN02745753_01082 [Marinomonas polaris DSM 16579]|uniref:Phage abortive infection protein n=1 Tax=Marinomonas polaris DSM 16579 TaxID=1122206 RepID=A0A1M4XIN9_9GAMM|nr:MULTISPECIES: hypothetical protein [Marinomonas]PJE56261.1 hypothetical protein TY87_05020 [Marinomonas sp. BSi20584]SHE93261.1 hypothetical protein SAMN02745753_01082 [Marinomonas polaris DSM 16579]
MGDISKGEKSSNISPKSLFFGVFVITVLVMIFFWWLYVDHVGAGFSDQGKNWSEFGSYFGGVLGPLFSAASILFVWWQSHKAMASQQDQLNKLNEQLGLEKQIIFRNEFVRLLTKATEQGEKKFVAGHVDCFKGRLGAIECSYKKLSRCVKPNSLQNDQKISNENLRVVWEVLRPYLANIFELADFLDKSTKFEVSENERVAYIRQFNSEFYTVMQEISPANQLLFIDELLKKPEIHGYGEISHIFSEPEKY